MSISPGPALDPKPVLAPPSAPEIAEESVIEAELPRTIESDLESAVLRALSSELFTKAAQLKFPADSTGRFQHTFSRAETEHFVSLTYELADSEGNRIAALVRNTYPAGSGMYIVPEPAGPVCSEFHLERELALTTADVWDNPEHFLKALPPEFADLAAVAQQQIKQELSAA